MSHGELEQDQREQVQAMSAATDNVGLFFGEDIFFAIASILLIQGVFESFGYKLAAWEYALWAIPTAICAFIIHSLRIASLDRRIGRLRAPSEGGAS